MLLRNYALSALTAIAAGPATATTPVATPDSAALVCAPDDHLEAVLIVGWLAGLLDDPHDSDYAGALSAWFRPHAGHPAVERVRRGYRDRLGELVIAGVDPSTADGAQESALADFVRSANVQGFLADHVAAREALCSTFLASAPEGVPAAAEVLFGDVLDGYRVVPSPLLRGFAVGHGATMPDGGRSAIVAVGPIGVRDGTPQWGSSGFLRRLLWHEIAHAFANPVLDEYADAIARSRLLFEPIRTRMRWAGGLTGWEGTVRELVARAVVALQWEGEARDRLVASEVAQGFLYIEEVLATLARHLATRSDSTTFRDFVPHLTHTLDSLALSGLEAERLHPAFRGPITRVGRDGEVRDLVMILPTQERDGEAQQRLWSNWRAIRNAHYPTSFLVADTDALDQDLRGYDLMVIGTPTGNRFLAAHFSQTGLAVSVGEVGVAGSRFVGAHHSVVTALPSPVDPRRAMYLSTAADPNDIGWWLWESDWAVMRGSEYVDGGDYGPEVWGSGE